MLDYLKWRGDLPMGAAPVNELDALVFSQLAYLHFRDALGEQGMSLQNAAKRVEALEREPGNPQVVADRHSLLLAAAESARFGNLWVSHAEDIFMPQLEMQFAAITFTLPDGSSMIAYRGTDATIVGWKEDFNMAFSCPVPSQTEAVRYLAAAAAAAGGAVRLCGHSKGGNLALYAAAFSPAEVRARIRQIDLFDAPGLDDASLATIGYRDVLPLVRAFVPQTSIIGRLMGVPEKYTVVHSNATGMNQHNIFTWMLDGPRFAMLPELDSTSRMIESTMNDFLRDSTPENRKMLVETLFAALNATNAHTLGDMADHWTDTAGALWDAIKKLDGATLRTVTSVLGSLATSGVESARRFLSYGDAPNGAFASGPGKTAVVKQTNDAAAVTDQPAAQDNPSVSGGMETLRRLIASFRDDSNVKKS